MCGGNVDDVGPLSARGKCESCGVELVTEAVDAMFSAQGEVYERWQSKTRRGFARYLEREAARLSSDDG